MDPYVASRELKVACTRYPVSGHNGEELTYGAAVTFYGYINGKTQTVITSRRESLKSAIQIYVDASVYSTFNEGDKIVIPGYTAKFRVEYLRPYYKELGELDYGVVYL